MRRRRNEEYGGDFATKDVAFGAFGTSALLMIVFILASGVYLARWHNSCRSVAPDELAQLADDTRRWMEGQRRHNSRLLVAVDRHCGQSQSRSGEQVARITRLLPEFLAGLCSEAVDAVLEKAGLQRSDLDGVGGQQLVLTSDLAACLGEEDSSCKILSDAEVPVRAAQVRSWFGAQKEQLAGTLRWLESEGRSCPPASQLPPVRGQVPADLSELCRSSRSRVFAELNQARSNSRITEEDLLRVTSELELARLRLNLCLRTQGDPGCRRLVGAERSAVTTAVKSWVAEAGRLSTELARLRNACVADGRTGLDRSSPDTIAIVGPLGLIDVCPADRADILQAAGVAVGEYERLRTLEQEMLAWARNCSILASTEVVTPPEAQVEFYLCESRMIGQSVNRVLSPELEARFRTIAALVLEKMRDESVNLIDILGHADSSPADQCMSEAKAASLPGTREHVAAAVDWLIREIVRDNYGLSVQRVIEFRKQLISALERLESEGHEGARRLMARIRTRDVVVRAIGMGNSRPIVAVERGDEDRKRNRRIELRFATERQGRRQ